MLQNWYKKNIFWGSMLTLIEIMIAKIRSLSRSIAKWFVKQFLIRKYPDSVFGCKVKMFNNKRKEAGWLKWTLRESRRYRIYFNSNIEKFYYHNAKYFIQIPVSEQANIKLSDKHVGNSQQNSENQKIKRIENGSKWFFSITMGSNARSSSYYWILIRTSWF